MSNSKGLFLPLSVIKGDTLDLPFDLIIDGEIQDFADYTLEGNFWLLGQELTETFDFTFEIDGDNPDLMHIIYSSNETELLAVGEYRYQVRVTDSNNITTTILYGSLTVKVSYL